MSSPADAFDSYHEWLGIEPHEQPADHYRLLGLARFEADAAKIAVMADERMAHVRKFQVGPRGRLTQKLLNELSAAKACLLAPAAKAAYDAELAQALSAAVQPRRVWPPPAPRSVAPPPIARPSPASDPLAEAAHPGSAAPWGTILLAITALALVVVVVALGCAVWWQRMNPPTAHAALPVVPEPVAPPSEPEPTPDERTVQLQEGSGEVTLTAATAQLDGNVELRHAGTTAVLGPWTSPEAAARWRFRLIQPGFFRAELKYASAAEATGAEVTISAGASTKTIALRSSGGLDQFIADTVTLAIPSGGQHDLLLTLPETLAGDWLLVESVRLIPVGGATPPAILPEE